jgi:anthranilate/para-aminobenzoate synthase component I
VTSPSPPPLHRVLLDGAPQAISLARRIADRPGLAVLWSGDGSGPSYLACDPVAASHDVDPEPTLLLSQDEDSASSPNRESPRWPRWPRWIGALPYEALRHERPGRGRRGSSRETPDWSAPLWYRYGAVAVVTDQVEVIGDDLVAVETLAARLSARELPRTERALRVELDPFEAPQLHALRIGRALELIGAGELYQVNLARRFSFSVRGHSLDMLAAMGSHTDAPFAAMMCTADGDFVATSPELLLELTPQGRLITSPIKGTRPRGNDPDSDARLAAELDADPKERAELAMILDVERNDLGRLAEPGTVKLVSPPHVITHPTIHHRAATLEARIKPNVSRETLFRTMVPSGSVTGAPKVRAMEVIAELEPHRRGLYTGGFGAIFHDGGVKLGMAIRTLTRRGDVGHYFAGGGIVADSRPDFEVEETLWKAAQLERIATPPEPDPRPDAPLDLPIPSFVSHSDLETTARTLRVPRAGRGTETTAKTLPVRNTSVTGRN